jgi:hypothetical protein
MTIAPTTIAPTTTAAAITTKGTTCATGGKCKVGDVGPAGGFVFHVSTASTGIETYLEAIPQRVGAGQQCDANTTKLPNAASLQIGDGLANTTAIYEVCGTGHSRSIIKNNKYYNRDWFIPTVGEMKAFVAQANAFKSPLAPNLSADQCLWTSSGPALVPGKEMTILAMRGNANGTYYSNTPVSSACDVQPIRSFTSTAVAQSVTTTTPTTLPPKPAPTTTVAAATNTTCAAGGTCKIGDTGPGGGIVFYVAPAPQPWGQFLEAPTKNIATNQFWCDNVATDIPGAQATALGSGRQNTVDMDAACKSGAGQAAADFVYGGKDDWYLPSKDELNAMHAQRARLNMVGYYFSSSEAKPQYAWDQYMGDGTPYPQGKNNGREVRPVRAFGATSPQIGTTGSPSQSIVPATTIPASRPTVAIPKPTVPQSNITTVPAKAPTPTQVTTQLVPSTIPTAYAPSTSKTAPSTTATTIQQPKPQTTLPPRKPTKKSKPKPTATTIKN